jgi:hypothetical protein
VTVAFEKSSAVASFGSKLTNASATGATSKILRGRIFMGGTYSACFGICEVFSLGFLAFGEIATYADSTNVARWPGDRRICGVLICDC